MKIYSLNPDGTVKGQCWKGAKNMSKKISQKENEKKPVVPGDIYVVSSDISSEQGEVLKCGSPVQVLQEPKEGRVAVKDFRGIQWDAGLWQLSKKAIQEMPARGRVWLSHTKIHLYSFFKAVDRNSWFIIWGSGKNRCRKEIQKMKNESKQDRQTILAYARQLRRTDFNKQPDKTILIDPEKEYCEIQNAMRAKEKEES